MTLSRRICEAQKARHTTPTHAQNNPHRPLLASRARIDHSVRARPSGPRHLIFLNMSLPPRLPWSSLRSSLGPSVLNSGIIGGGGPAGFDGCGFGGSW